MQQRPLHSLLRHLRETTAHRPFATTPDRDLVRRFAVTRDEPAFEELVRRHGPMVLGVCSRVLQDGHSADDAFQATFLVLARKASTLSRPELIGNWLYGVAYRLANKLRVKQRRRRETPIVDEHVDAATSSMWPEFAQVLDQEVERLPEKFRAAFVLCYLEGNTHEQAARILGCPTGSMSWRLDRARALLRERLTRRGITLTAALAAAALAPAYATSTLRASLVSGTVQAALAFVRGNADGASAEMFALARHGLSTLGAGQRVIVAMMLVCGAVGIGAIAMLRLAATPEAQPLAARTPASERTQSSSSKAIATDRHGDPLPKNVVARLGTTRFRTSAFIHQIALSPDGRIVASADADGEHGGSLRLWDAGSGREIRRLGSDEKVVYCVAFSRDGKLVASGDHEAFIPGRQAREISHARVWNVATGKEARSFVHRALNVRSVSFSPDGMILATATAENAVHLWDLKTGQERGRLLGLERSVASVVFAPTGQVVASCAEDKTVRVWDARTFKELQRFEAEVGDLAFSRDGSLLVGGSLDKTIYLWDVTQNKRLLLLRLEGPWPGRSGLAVALSPDGKSVVSGPEVTVWDVQTGKPRSRLSRNKLEAYSLVYSDDGRIIAGACGESIHLWNAATGDELTMPGGHAKRIWSIDYFADGARLASASGDGSVCVWDLASAREVLRVVPPPVAGQYPGCTCSVSPTGKVLATTANNGAQLWDANAGKEIRSLPTDPDEYVQRVAFSPDGKLLAVGSANTVTPVRLWDTLQGKWVRELEIHGAKAEKGGEGVNGLVFSPDGKRLAAGCPDGSICLWDLHGSSKPDFLDHASPPAGGTPAVTAIAMSPDGRMLATATGYNSQSVRLWDIERRKEVCQLEGLTIGTESLAFSPDGRMLVGGDRLGMLCLWEVASGKERHRWKTGQGGVSGVRFAPNGRTIATGGADTTVLIWDVAALERR